MDENGPEMEWFREWRKHELSNMDGRSGLDKINGSVKTWFGRGEDRGGRRNREQVK